MEILIKNGRIIDPKNKLDKISDLLISDGIIKKIEDSITDRVDKIIDAEGFWVTPGLIDIHVHLREPGQEHKETIKTGSLSGAAGGFTTICPMANTSPVIDSPETVNYIVKKSEEDAVINIMPIGSLTKNMDGEELTDFKEIKEAGAVALSEDGKTLINPYVMLSALKEAKKLDLVVLDHCEDRNIKRNGVIHEGRVSEMLGLDGIPKSTEDIIVARDIVLAESVDTRLHICHVSTKETVNLVRDSKKRGSLVTAEVTPHHFTLTVEDIKTLDTNYKMAPPLRTYEDVLAIKKALKENIIEVIASDHAPHADFEKNESFDKAPNGIVGLETTVPLGITNLVNTGDLTPMEFVEKLTINPAKIMNIDRGTLTEGKIADITIINPNKEYEIDVKSFKSKSKNSPFNGYKVKGKVMYTLVKGKIVYKN